MLPSTGQTARVRMVRAYAAASGKEEFIARAVAIVDRCERLYDDAQYAQTVVVLAESIVPFPNTPAVMGGSPVGMSIRDRAIRSRSESSAPPC